MGISPDKAFEWGLVRDARGNWVNTRKAQLNIQTSGEPEQLEGVLQRKIAKWLEDHGALYSQQRMDKKSTAKVGTPDFIIAFPGGITLWIECKARREKPKPEQIGWAMRLEQRGHLHAFVWNMEDFLKAVARVDIT